ncbi:MAG TPA: cytochrome c3 family protein [Patescibacteria group bacterium]|nr:cytochrome c3 family protein [Patescibacteria group bacterium]
MRIFRSGVLAFAAIAFASFATSAYGYHSGGVGECTGCHSMHSPKPGGTFLLVGTDQSSTCLSCHQNASDTGPSSYHISTAPGSLGPGQAPLQRGPGGDFGWIKKDYSFTVRGSTINEDGDTHGHNIVAVDFLYAADATNATSPGGTFPSNQLSCNSCHDNHGQYRRLSSGVVSKTGAPIYASGSYYNGTSVTANEPTANEAVGVYRLLAGAGYTKGGVTFNGVPAAKTPSSYNRTEASTQTRTSYGNSSASGHISWGNWCGTCHTDMHSSGNYVHPVDRDLGSTIATNYEQYVMTGNMTGSAASSFTSLVPFVKNSGDYAGVLAPLAVNNDSQLGGPATNDQVTCLSCHRAHASGWEFALRWNMEGEFMTYNSLYPGTDTTPTVPQFARGRLAVETQAAYYDRPVTKFASYQRVLCNKCHAND